MGGKMNLDLWKSLISPSGSRENHWRLLVDTKGQPKETIKISLGTADKQKAVEVLHQKAAEGSGVYFWHQKRRCFSGFETVTETVWDFQILYGRMGCL
jgi:hypothetical protein